MKHGGGRMRRRAFSGVYRYEEGEYSYGTIKQNTLSPTELYWNVAFSYYNKIMTTKTLTRSLNTNMMIFILLYTVSQMRTRIGICW